MDSNYKDIQKKLVADKDKLSELIAEKISEQVEDATENLEDAADHVEESLNKLQECTDELKSSLSGCSKIVESVDTVSQKVETLSKLSDELASSNADVIETLEKSINDIRSCVDSAVAILNSGGMNLDQAFKDSISQIENYCMNVCNCVQACTAEIIENTKQFQNSHNAMLLLLDKVGDAKKSIRQLIETFSESVSSGVKSVEEISKVFDLSTSSTEKLVQNFQSNGEKIDVTLNEFSNKINQITTSLDNFEESMHKLLFDFEEKYRENVSKNQLLGEDIFRIEEFVKLQGEMFKISEEKKAKQFSVTIGIMALILLLQILIFFV